MAGVMRTVHRYAGSGRGGHLKRILLVSYFPPSEEHAGGQRLLDLYAEMKSILPELYVALVTCGDNGVDYDLLKSIFNEVHCLSDAEFSKLGVLTLIFEGGNFDVVDLQYHQSGALIRASRKRWPSAKLIFHLWNLNCARSK